MKTDDEILREIDELVGQLWKQRLARASFTPGTTSVSYAGRVFDESEVRALVRTSLDFWLTAGPVAGEFEKELAALVGTKYSLLVNSGSSANLCAISSLASPKLKRRLRPGDEVITAAAAFPTTVNPIVQNGWLPVFVDIELGSYNVPLDYLDAALSPKTRAVVLAHTMGFPFDAEAVAKFCKERDLYLVEDCCDALGATVRGRRVGTFGDLATLSFFPAHQMTTGEGGAVLTSSGKMNWIARSFRDWGRDCWCEPGEDDVCRKRFGFQLGSLPEGFDHKYTYTHVGYNLKALDLQAAIGREQLKKVPSFVAARRQNWAAMRKHMEKYEEYFILPEAAAWMEPSPFGLVLTVREDAPFTKNEITAYLEAKKVQTRGLFAGNILRHPAYETIDCRVAMPLVNSDAVTMATFFVGVYPGIDDARRDYILAMFDQFLAQYR